jgi:hypothetical protein
MMTSLNDEFQQLEIGERCHFRNLTLFPLLRRTALAEPDYVLLEDAILHDTARITELNAGGSVPELRFENGCERPVLLLDGEELIGAKQNRVLNLTILAPAKHTLVIPVSCVEAGRWHMETPEFKLATHLMYSRARAARTAHVTQSMRTSGACRSDQSALWDELALKAVRVDAQSPTRAMSAMYERHALSVEEYARAFGWQERQAGVAFAICGQLLGLDLLDHCATARRLFPKLVRSYAMDALDAPQHRTDPAGEQQLAEFLAHLTSSPMFSQPAVGLGKDIRLGGSAVAGAALWAEDRYVHVCAFATNGNTVTPGFRTRMNRPSHRVREAEE